MSWVLSRQLPSPLSLTISFAVCSGEANNWSTIHAAGRFSSAEVAGVAVVGRPIGPPPPPKRGRFREFVVTVQDHEVGRVKGPGMTADAVIAGEIENYRDGMAMDV